MCIHYAGDKLELLKNLLDFYAFIGQEKIVAYKAKNGELALKFPSQGWRDKFIQEMGGVSHFSKDEKFNPNKACPQIYSDNRDLLYALIPL